MGQRYWTKERIALMVKIHKTALAYSANVNHNWQIAYDEHRFEIEKLLPGISSKQLSGRWRIVRKIQKHECMAACCTHKVTSDFRYCSFHLKQMREYYYHSSPSFYLGRKQVAKCNDIIKSDLNARSKDELVDLLAGTIPVMKRNERNQILSKDAVRKIYKRYKAKPPKRWRL